MIKYKSGYKYQLQRPAVTAVYLGPDHILTEYIEYDTGVLMVRKGYAWDGASFPAIDCNANMRASLFHDAGYQLLRSGLLRPTELHRKTLDMLYSELCIEDGMSSIRARLDYWGLQQFASFAASPRNTKKAKIAP